MIESNFFTDFFKALLSIGALGAVMALIAMFISFIIDITNFREEKSHMSTGVGNALLMLHQFLEPGRKPQTEQVIFIKKRRTPLEKKLVRDQKISYDLLYIGGYRKIGKKKFTRL